MLESVFKFLDFVTDKTKSLGHRLKQLVFIILALLAINDLFSFTQNFALNRKLDQILKYKEIDPSVMSNPKMIERIDNLEHEIFKDKSIIRSTIASVAQKIQSLGQEDVRILSKDEITKNERYSRYISASIVWLTFSFVCMLLIPMLVGSSEVKSVLKGLVVLSFIFIVFALITTALLSLVPTFNKLWINHSINIIFNIIVLMFLGYTLNKKGKNR